MRWILSGNRGMLALAIALSVVAYIFAGALMFTSGYMISLAATLPLSALVLHLPSIFVRIFGIGKPPIQYAYRLTSHDWVLRMTSKLRLCLYDALRRKTTISQSREKTSRVLSMLTDDIGHAQDIVLRGILPIALAWILAVLIVVFTGALSPTLAIILFVLLMVSCVIAPLMVSSANAKELKELKSKQNHLYDSLTDNMQGMADWILSGRRDDFISIQMSLFEEKDSIERRIKRRRRICLLISQVLFCLCILAIFIWTALTFAPALQGNATAGAIASSTGFANWIAGLSPVNSSPYPANWIAAFALCFFPLIEAFSQVEQSAESYRQQNGSVDELIEYMGDSVNSRASDFDNDKDSKLRHIANPDISIRNLVFSYGNCKVFDGLNLEIPYGEKVAIMGRSGIGKTTLVSILHADLFPDRGEVLVGGIDAKLIANEMHKTICVIGQFPYLFDMSLRDNLLIAKPDSRDEKLVCALEMVGLKDMFDSLERGLDTRMEEGGKRFSGGERHRIALARIFLANQPIIILDEPFANLDSKTAEDISNVIFKLFSEKTVIVITHRANNLDIYDRIIEL